MCKTDKLFPGFPYTEKYYNKVKNLTQDERLEYNVLNTNEFEGLVLGGDKVYPGPKINYLCESVRNYFLEFFKSRTAWNVAAYKLSENYKYRLHGFCYALDMICDFYDDCVKFVSYKYHRWVDDPKTHISQKIPFVFYIRPDGEIYYTRRGKI